MYSVMWSEHCSYKSSRIHLRRFPTEAPWVLVGPGEGAGVVDVGDGIAAAIRIESHNHPSAIEPYQGAATGVGGILRDIFSMGARPDRGDGPAAVRPAGRRPVPLDRRGRRVGHLRLRQLRRACPPWAARRCSTRAYADNPLVNVLCLGLMPVERLVLGRAEGVGNLAVLLGLDHRARRHRRGLGAGVGRLLRRRGRRRQAAERAGGRPVRGEAPDRGLPGAARTRDLAVGVQDLGGAGITCATAETAAKGGAGMDVDRGHHPPPRAGHGAVRGHDLGVPGAHAGHRRAVQPGRGPRPSPSGGRSGPP